MNGNNKKFLSTLGLATKAGATVCGTPNVCEALKAGKLWLVFEAKNSSENTHKRLCDRCAYYGIELIRTETDAAELAHAVGKTAELAAVGITDANFCKALKKHVSE